MAKKPEPIVRLAAQTARQIFANSGNYAAAVRGAVVEALENSVAYIMLTRCGIDPQEYFSGEDFARIYDFNTLKTLAILGAAASDIAGMPLREIASTVLPLYWEEEKQNRTFAGNPDRQYNDGRTKPERSVEYGADIQNRGRLSTAQSDVPEAPQVGKYGMLRRSFLTNHRHGIYTGMLLTGELNTHLAEIDHLFFCYHKQEDTRMVGSQRCKNLHR